MKLKKIFVLPMILFGIIGCYKGVHNSSSIKQSLTNSSNQTSSFTTSQNLTSSQQTTSSQSSVTSSINQNIPSDEIFSFNKINDSYSVSLKYLPNNIKELSIPETYNGLKIIVIETHGFSNASELEKVILPEGILSIEDYAFANCMNLNEIKLPNSLKHIGENAFQNCSSLKFNNKSNCLYLGNDKNPYLALMSSIETSEENINLIDSTKIIYSNALNNYKKLKSLILPNSLLEVGENAFPNSSFLVYTEYEGCYYLGSKENPYMVLIKHLNKNAQTVNVNQDTKIIYSAAFYESSNLTNVFLPTQITDIGSYAFENCYKLKTINIPSTLICIKDGVFTCCELLNEIILNDSILSIGNYAFSYCTSLISIVLPNSLSTLKESVFYNCSSLNYNVDQNCAFIGSKENPYLVLIKSLNKDMNEITINKNTRFIHFEAFADCTLLEKVILPNSIISLDSGIFKNNSALKNIILPCSLKTIPYEAFYNCSSLNEVTIPDQLKVIESYSFANCSLLSNFSFKENIFIINSHAFENTHLNSAEIESKNLNLGEYAFYNCSSLSSITLNGVISHIKEYTFANCPLLENISIPESIEKINQSAFDNCSSLVFNEYSNCNYLGNEKNPYIVLMSSVNKYITETIINSETKVIYNSAFLDCTKITSIIIPYKVYSINDMAFYGCSSLNELKFETNSNLSIIGNYIFRNCKKLKSIELPNSLYEKGNGTFYGCTSLEEVMLPKNTTSIKNEEYFNCSSLKGLIIPSTIKEIGLNALYNCSSLTFNTYGNCSYLGNEENPYLALVKSNHSSIVEASININTTIIVDHAFYGCWSLKTIIIPIKVEFIGAYAFSECTSLTIYCESDRKQSGWSSTWNNSNRPVEYSYSAN